MKQRQVTAVRCRRLPPGASKATKDLSALQALKEKASKDLPALRALRALRVP